MCALVRYWRYMRRPCRIHLADRLLLAQDAASFVVIRVVSVPPALHLRARLLALVRVPLSRFDAEGPKTTAVAELFREGRGTKEGVNSEARGWVCQGWSSRVEVRDRLRRRGQGRLGLDESYPVSGGCRLRCSECTPCRLLEEESLNCCGPNLYVPRRAVSETE